MKKIFSIALFAALMVSCNNFDIENEGVTPDGGATTGDAIEFYAEESTKTTYFEGEGLGVNWEEGDKVAIRLVDAAHTTALRQRANYKATTAGASTTFERTDTWADKMEWIDGKDNCIVAWYPATNNANANAVDIYLSTDQTQAKAGDHSHISDLMVMKTSKQTWTADEEKPARVGLQFRNVYSIIELTLKSNESGKTISKVEINSASTALTFSGKTSVSFFTTFVEDDAQGLVNKSGSAPTTGVKSVNTTLNEPADLTAEGAKIYFVVLPGEHANGDLTITTHFTDGTSIDQKMGSIKFERNKVYRPTVELKNLPVAEAIEYATIKHYFSDYSNSGKDVTYGDPIDITESTTVPFIGRTYVLGNLPKEILGKKMSTIQYTTYPSENSIEALSDGYVYLLVGGGNILNSIKSGSTPTILAYGGQYQLAQDGWTAVTTEANTTKSVTNDMISYNNASTGDVVGSLVLYKKEMKKGDTYDLTRLYHYINQFQGIRPIAKEITNVKTTDNNEDLTLILDFRTAQSGWDFGVSNFDGVVANAYDGEMEMTANMYNTKVALDFYCYKEDGTNISGTCYHNNNLGLLMNNQAMKSDLSIGMPAIEGYQLKTVEIEAWPTSTVKPTVGLSSTEAPVFTAVGSDAAVWTTTNKDNQDNLVLTVAEEYRTANTPYYFYAMNTSVTTVRLQAIYLTYEKAN